MNQDNFNLAIATAQQVLDRVMKHARTQQAKAIDGHKCKYRLAIEGHDTLMCFAGYLIPDSIYQENFEGRAWTDLTIAGMVNSNHSNLIYSLQLIHDISPVTEWEMKFKDLVNAYNRSSSLSDKLVYTPPQEQVNNG